MCSARPGKESLQGPILRSVYEVDVEVSEREDSVEVRPRVDAAGFTRTGSRLDEPDRIPAAVR